MQSTVRKVGLTGFSTLKGIFHNQVNFIHNKRTQIFEN